MRSIAVKGIYLLLLFSSSLCAFASGPNLCRQQEDTYFTCTLKNGKLASVCGTDDLSDHAGYLVYRYGTKQKLELNLPGSPGEFRRFSSAIELVDDKTSEDDQFVRFKNGKFSYIIYSASSYKFDFMGLAVFENYKLLSNNQCSSDTSDWGLGQNSLLSVGVPLQDADEAMRFWKSLLPSSSAVLSQK